MRERTERLAAPLTAEDQMVQSMPDTSPTKWHRAHTTWFFAEFVLGATGMGPDAWDRPEYRFLYDIYYEAVGARHPRPERGLVTRPTIDDVAEYRSGVDQAMAELLAAPEQSPDVAERILLGTHHEEQHQELLLIDIKHAFSMNPAVSPAYTDVIVPSADDPGPAGFIDVPGGVVEIGRRVDADGFGFDNEGRRHEVRVYDVGWPTGS